MAFDKAIPSICEFVFNLLRPSLMDQSPKYYGMHKLFAKYSIQLFSREFLHISACRYKNFNEKQFRLLWHHIIFNIIITCLFDFLLHYPKFVFYVEGITVSILEIINVENTFSVYYIHLSNLLDRESPWFIKRNLR